MKAHRHNRTLRTQPLFSIVLLLALLASGCATQSVALTAANTSNPVLLGKVDRIGGGSGGATRPSALTTTPRRPITLTLSDSRTFVTDGQYSSTTTESRDNDKKTDFGLLSATLGDPETNVWTNSLAVTYYSIYLLFGYVENNQIHFDGHTAKAASTPAQVTRELSRDLR